MAISFLERLFRRTSRPLARELFTFFRRVFWRSRTLREHPEYQNGGSVDRRNSNRVYANFESAEKKKALGKNEEMPKKSIGRFLCYA